MFKNYIALSCSILIVGCTATPQEKRLDEYLSETKTESKERSIDWYYRHDYERNDVLDICYSIYLDSAKKAGYYSDDVSDGREKYLDETVQKEMYASNEDCSKAYKAQDILDNFIASKSLPEEATEDKFDAQQLPSSAPIASTEVPTDAIPSKSEQEPLEPPTLEELTNDSKQ